MQDPHPTARVSFSLHQQMVKDSSSVPAGQSVCYRVPRRSSLVLLTRDGYVHWQRVGTAKVWSIMRLLLCYSNLPSQLAQDLRRAHPCAKQFILVPSVPLCNYIVPLYFLCYAEKQQDHSLAVGGRRKVRLSRMSCGIAVETSLS